MCNYAMKRIRTLAFIAALIVAGCDLLTSPATRVERATSQIAAGDYRDAVFELRKVLEDDPAHARARLLLAEAELGSGDVTAAEADLDRALQAGAAPQAVAPLKAQLQLALGRAQVLITQLDAGEIVLPEPQASIYRGRALQSLRQPAAALRSFEAALANSPESLEARIGVAEARAANGNVSAALDDLAAITKSDPTAALAWLVRGSLLLQLGRHAEAEADLAEARKHAKGRLNETMQLQVIASQVDARLAMNDLDRAEEGMVELQRRAAKAPVTRLLKARIALMRNDLSSAITGLTELTSDLPDFMPARYMLGSAMLAQGNLYQAERQLSVVVQANPDHLEARKRLAEIRLRMNRPEAAIELLSSSLDGGFTDPRAVALLGAAQLRVGADPSAIAKLEEAVTRQPGNRSARLDLAGLYITAGHAGRAIELLQATPVSKDDARREFLLIQAVATTHGEAKARAEIERMIRDNPGDVERLNLAAGFLLSFGDEQAATAMLEKALAVRSDHVPTLINLSRAQLASGNLDGAEAMLRSAMTHDQANVEARIGLAEIAGRRGKTDEAKRWLEEIRTNDAKAVAPRLLLARLYLAGQETAKASKVLAEALAAAPNRTDVLVAAGALQQDFGRHEQALGYYRKAADLEPRQPEHWLNVGRAQAALGYQPAARESVERALGMNPVSVDAVALAVMLDIIDGHKETALERVVELRGKLPRDSNAAMLEGDTRALLGQHAEAAKAFGESARLRPSVQAVLRQTQARQLARVPDPRAPLREWLRNHPDDLPARAMNAVYLDQAGLADQAIAEYEQVLAAGTPDAVMSNNLAWRYFEKGDPRAESLARQAYRLAPTSGAIADTLGWILVQKGAKGEGIRLLREATGLAPQEPEIQLHLAEALVTADMDAEARDVLKKLLDNKKAFAGQSRAQALLRQAGG